MTKIEFGEICIRCSALYYLFMDPKTKAAKEAGELSETAKNHLINTYIWEKYRRRKSVSTPAMEKGKLVQGEAIAMCSRMHGVSYEPNDERRSNGFITGETDVSIPVILDVKASWEAETFLAKLKSGVDPIYAAQVQGYMWLWGQPLALVSYCLVSTPEVILAGERRKLFYVMNCATEDDPAYQDAVAELEYNLVFDDIPEEERVLTYEIPRDDTMIARIPEKVERAREFLTDFANQHNRFIEKYKARHEAVI